MSNPILWKLAHGLCVTSYACMFVASFIAFAGTDIGLNEGFNTSIYIHAAPWGAAAVAMIGTISSAALFAKLSELDDPNQNETTEKRHLKRQTTVVIGVAFSLCLIIADIITASALANASNMVRHNSTTPLNVDWIITGARIIMDLCKLIEWSKEMHGVHSLLEDVERNDEIDEPYRD
ncbi:uncharacterized protein LTHEOB_4590 [Lasiodiplodia theobromae]|uniref:uncharacterized protein n=1 Tax=Lasiodiplodia theobromae TaxID=45133 RepID=UPI0015C2FFAF|nr:uncharacterized protein LTHEOB_4590 [Lasiodiplodia theobromae]KAF4545938.1 hypothetical protein LTHEOB_4590 [Lasiodiplodia theobromae]